MGNTNCRSDYKNGVLTLKVTGEIDHHTAKGIREKTDAAIYLYRAHTVILDLSGVGFMDSSGLGLIMGRYTNVRKLGGRLMIADPEPEVEKILSLASMDKLVEIKRKEAAI